MADNVTFLNMRALLSYCSDCTRKVTLLRNQWEDKKDLITEIRSVLEDIHDEIRNSTGDASTLPQRVVLLSQSKKAIQVIRELTAQMEVISIESKKIRALRDHYDDLYYNKLVKMR